MALSKEETKQLEADIAAANRKHAEDNRSPMSNMDEVRNLMEHATPLVKKAVKDGIVYVDVPSEYYRAVLRFKEGYQPSMQGGWCECGHHSMSHERKTGYCTETACGCKAFRPKG